MRDKKGQFVKGQHHSLNTEFKKGHGLGGHLSKVTKEKIRISNLGQKRSEKTRIKISESHMGKSSGMKGKHHTKEVREKIRQDHLGKSWGNHSERAKENISKKQKGQHHSIKTEFKEGKDHHNWQGGLSFEPYSIDWTKTLKKSIRERDHYLCQLCSEEGYLVHHLDYNKKNCNSNNLITLCRKCHAKTNYNRKYWKRYLCQIMKIKMNGV